MKYKFYSFNHAESILKEDDAYTEVFRNIINIIENISDFEIMQKFEEIGKNSKSISNTITSLLEEKLLQNNWIKELPIFNNFSYESKKSKRWTLDFYKDKIQLEIAFNHEEGTAWNIMKIPLANQPNIYKHKQRVEMGIIISVTNQMKRSGGYDGSVGSYEKYIEYLSVFKPFVPTPILLIGLQSPDDFKIKHRNINRKKIGQVKEIL